MNFEGLEMQKCNIPTERELKELMKKIGPFVLLLCLLPELWSSKCQKLLILCIFCWWQQKNIHIFGKYSTASQRSYRVHSENGMVNRLWNYRLWDVEGRNNKKTAQSTKKVQKYCIFKGSYYANGSLETNNP